MYSRNPKIKKGKATVLEKLKNWLNVMLILICFEIKPIALKFVNFNSKKFFLLNCEIKYKYTSNIGVSKVKLFLIILESLSYPADKTTLLSLMNISFSQYSLICFKCHFSF